MDMNTIVSILPNEIVDMICFKFKGLQHPFFKITDEFIEIRRNKILIFEYAKLKKNLWFDEYTIVEAENWADDLMDRITYGDSMLQLYTGNEVCDEYLYDEEDRIYHNAMYSDRWDRLCQSNCFGYQEVFRVQGMKSPQVHGPVSQCFALALPPHRSVMIFKVLKHRHLGRSVVHAGTLADLPIVVALSQPAPLPCQDDILSKSIIVLN